jgi:hypothetical protein
LWILEEKKDKIQTPSFKIQIQKSNILFLVYCLFPTLASYIT